MAGDPLGLTLDLLVVWLAFALRVWGLGNHSLWLDEALAVLRSSADLLTAILGRTSIDLAPPLYPLLLHAWARLGGPDFWLRFLSAVSSTLAVVALLRLPDRRVGRAAAALMAVAPTPILYAQEATVYSLVALLSAALLVTATRAAEGNRWAWLAFGCLAVIGLYAYYGLIFLMVPLAGWLLARAWGRRRVGRPQALGGALLVGHALVGVVILPLLPLASRQSNTVLETWWGQYGTLENWLSVGLFMRGSVADGLVFPVFAFATPPAWLVAALVGLLALGAQRRPAWFLAGWLVPLALAYLASALGRYPFAQRYLLIVAPIVYALMGVALVGISDRLARRGQDAPRLVAGHLVVACLAVLLVGTATPGALLPWSPRPPREAIRPLLRELAQRHAPQDGVYVTYGAGPATHVYQGQGLAPTNAVIEDEWLAGRVDYQASRALAAGQERDRLWVVVGHAAPGEEEALATALTRRGAWLRERVTAPGATLLRFDLPARPPDQSPILPSIHPATP